MTAVVGPVCIHDANFGDGGISVFLVTEIGLQEFQIVQIHRKAQLLQQFGKARFIQGNKAVHSGNGLRRCILYG